MGRFKGSHRDKALRRYQRAQKAISKQSLETLRIKQNVFWSSFCSLGQHSTLSCSSQPVAESPPDVKNPQNYRDPGTGDLQGSNHWCQLGFLPHLEDTQMRLQLFCQVPLLRGQLLLLPQLFIQAFLFPFIKDCVFSGGSLINMYTQKLIDTHKCMYVHIQAYCNAGKCFVSQLMVI